MHECWECLVCVASGWWRKVAVWEGEVAAAVEPFEERPFVGFERGNICTFCVWEGSVKWSRWSFVGGNFHFISLDFLLCQVLVCGHTLFFLPRFPLTLLTQRYRGIRATFPSWLRISKHTKTNKPRAHVSLFRCLWARRTRAIKAHVQRRTVTGIAAGAAAAVKTGPGTGTAGAGDRDPGTDAAGMTGTANLPSIALWMMQTYASILLYMWKEEETFQVTVAITISQFGARQERTAPHQESGKAWEESWYIFFIV